MSGVLGLRHRPIRLAGQLDDLTAQYGSADMSTWLQKRAEIFWKPSGIGAVPKRPADMQLGPRQHQIAELAAHGHTNDEIATMLGISVNTVKGRLKEVFEILEVRNRTELVLKAIQRGLA